MKTWLIVIFLVYSLGIFLVKYTDSIIPDDVIDEKNHSLILCFMWIFSPLLIVTLILYVLYLIIFKSHGKK
jgi:hypothetical protein